MSRCKPGRLAGPPALEPIGSENANAAQHDIMIGSMHAVNDGCKESLRQAPI